MKQVLGLMVITFFLFVGCEDIFEDIFGEPVGETSINEHSIEWDSNSGKPRSITLYWDWAEHTDEHILERSAPDDGLGFQELLWDAVDHYYDNGSGLPEGEFIPGHRYIYRVCGHASDEKGPWSPEYTVTIPPFLPPENVAVELLDITLDEWDDDVYNVRVRISWDPVDMNDVYYEVFMCETLEGYYTNISNRKYDHLLEYEFYLTIEDPAETISRYFKVKTGHPDYGWTGYSEAAYVDIRADDGGKGGSGSWVGLGSDGFANTKNELVSATVGSTLYVGFPDSNNSNHIKVISHDGSESGSWTNVGDHLSLDAAEWDELSLVEINGALYVGYADTDESVTSGGSSKIFIKQIL